MPPVAIVAGVIAARGARSGRGRGGCGRGRRWRCGCAGRPGWGCRWGSRGRLTRAPGEPARAAGEAARTLR